MRWIVRGAWAGLALTLFCAPGAAAAEEAAPEITRFVACADVADKECVGEDRRFGLDVGTVWAYAEVDNRAPPMPVVMVWRRDGQEVFTAELEIGRSRRWRTWSRKRIGARDEAGWTVELRRADLPRAAAPMAVLAFAVGDAAIPPPTAPHGDDDPGDAPPGLALPIPPPHHDEPPAEGEATPDRQPEVAPTPAPAPVPEPTPQTTPLPTPDPQPEAPPTPAPGAQPGAPPTPAPEPQPTPDPQPAPAPQPEPTPEPQPAPAAPTPRHPPALPGGGPAVRPPTPTPPPPPPAADAVCRAWVAVRADGPDGPRYHSYDVRFGGAIEAHPAPGLVIRGQEELHALSMIRRRVREAGVGGEVVRSWDMLMGIGLDSGQRRVWAGFPATMAPPRRGEGPRFEQTHTVEVVSIIGPYLGLRARLLDRGPEGPTERALARTVTDRGVPRMMVDDVAALTAAFARLPKARQPDPAAFPNSYAVVLGPRGPALLAIAPCCGVGGEEPVAVEAPIALPDDLAAGVTEAGGFRSPEGCTVEQAGRRIRAKVDARAATIGSAGEALVGVTWVPVSHHHQAERQAQAVQRLR